MCAHSKRENQLAELVFVASDEHEFTGEAFVSRIALRIEMEIGLFAFLHGDDLAHDREGAIVDVDVTIRHLDVYRTGFIVDKHSRDRSFDLDIRDLLGHLSRNIVMEGDEQELPADPASGIFGSHETSFLAFSTLEEYLHSSSTVVFWE